MRKMIIAICGLVLTIAGATGVKADADGPDFFRVVGVGSNDVLNIRVEPTASSHKVGTIPHDGDGIRNLGCEGGLSYAEWAEASEAERKAAEHRRWCHISYKGAEGWAAGRFLGEGSTPQEAAPSPSFDCDRADSSVEEAICNDPRLARLDNELARLYGLAVNGPYMSQDRLNELKATQRDWIKGRNDCRKSDREINTCIATSYAIRIDDVRTGYFDSRQDDAAGVSTGPFAYVCDGLDAIVSVVSVAVDPGILSLQWRDNRIAPVAVPSGSGTKYEAQTADGHYEFWSKGEKASFTFPDGAVLDCKQDEIG